MSSVYWMELVQGRIWAVSKLTLIFLDNWYPSTFNLLGQLVLIDYLRETILYCAFREDIVMVTTPYITYVFIYAFLFSICHVTNDSFHDAYKARRALLQGICCWGSASKDVERILL
jgi:hypothetical protein